jgi:hypothetical protein
MFGNILSLGKYSCGSINAGQNIQVRNWEYVPMEILSEGLTLCMLYFLRMRNAI